MFRRSAARALGPRDSRRARSTRSRRRRLSLEALEDRHMLAVFTVSNLDDGPVTMAGDQPGTLRQAIFDANAAAGDDTIEFAPGLTGTIMLTAGELTITEQLTIDGPGAGLLAIDASGNDPTPTIDDGLGSRIFLIDDSMPAVDNPVMIRGVTLTGGDTNVSGGGIRALESLTLIDVTVIDNASTDDGGGIFVSTPAGVITITNSRVTGNRSGDLGGGIYAYTSSGSATISASTFAGNEADYGGGIFSRTLAGAVTIASSTISGNTTRDNSGGGLFAQTNMGTTTLVNSTVSGNNAGGDGGGVFAWIEAGTMTIAHSTITGNTSDVGTSGEGSGGGVYAMGAGMLVVDHTIVAGNTDNTAAAPDIDGLTSPPGGLAVDFSLVGDNAGSGLMEAAAPDAAGNLIGSAAGAGVIVPLLGPLADNGGTTLTHALLPGSPAIDAGNMAAMAGVGGVPAFDQRGTPFARVVDGDGDMAVRIDIGAFELPAPMVTVPRVTLNAAMELEIRDVVPGGVDDDLSLAVEDGVLVVRDPNRALSSDVPGTLGEGTNELRIPLAAIVGGRVVVETLEGNDTLAVDATVAAAGLAVDFDGGAGNDALAVHGTGTETAIYMPDAATPGSGVVVVDGMAISFTGLEPVDISGMMAVTVLLPNGADVLSIEEGFDFASGGMTAALRVAGTSGGVAIETAALWNNETVTIDTTAVDGADAITIVSAANDHQNQNLVILTGAGADTITVAGAATFSGDVEIQTQNVALAATISAGGRVTIDAGTGAIVDGAADDATKIAGAEALLKATTGIGTANPLETAVERLDVTNAAAVAINLVNAGALEIIDLDMDGLAVASAGAAMITVTGALAISSDVAVGGASTFTAGDTAGPGDDLTIAGGAIVIGNGHNLTFNAGDNFLLAAGATINTPAGLVFVNGDVGDADVPDVGSAIAIGGEVMAAGMTLNGGDDNDTFVIVPSVTTPIAVNGMAPVAGDPGVPPGDRLIVALAGITDAVVPTVPPPNGVITFSAASHQPITYVSIESLLAIGPDALEDNDTLATATVLGSQPTVILTGLTIDSPGDEDFFKITAHSTGKLIVRALFEHAVGDLDIEIQDMFGNPIALAQSETDDEELIIPVVSQQMYFVRVFGFAGAVNLYSLEIENFPAPVPTVVHLDPASNTGPSNDNVTANPTPRFFIQADLFDFESMGIPVDRAAGAPGADVELQLFGATNGVSQTIDATRLNGPVWEATVTVPLAPGLYFVQAATRITDGQVAAATGRSQLSPPLWITIAADEEGPRITEVAVTGTDFDLLGAKGTVAPTPLVDSITIRLEDLALRTMDFMDPALNELLVESPSHFRLVGDRSGVIPIVGVDVINDPVVIGEPATASIVLQFAAPLPDDRFTLTVFDTVVDPSGNALDGEANILLPSGNGVAGGDFVTRFTVDSRPEIGVWAAGTVLIDINGNFVFDPTGGDPANRDIAYHLGFPSDHIFAGNFVAGEGDTADGFDKLAAYGRVGNQWRWLIDFDNDGVPDGIFNEAAINGIPVAGNFDGSATNGDEVGIFTGTEWHLDTDHDFVVDTIVPAMGYGGYPVVGDFNGDGLVDLATYRPASGENLFSIVLATAAGVWPSTATVTFRVGVPGLGFHGFPGVRERPVAADMNGDGIDDIGLWVPDGVAMVPTGQAEWFFLLSRVEGGVTTTVLDRIASDGAGNNFVAFTPFPFGDDLYASFGNAFAQPIVGNFDPPTRLLPAIAAPPASAAAAPPATLPASQANGAVPTAAMLAAAARNAASAPSSQVTAAQAAPPKTASAAISEATSAKMDTRMTAAALIGLVAPGQSERGASADATAAVAVVTVSGSSAATVASGAATASAAAASTNAAALSGAPAGSKVSAAATALAAPATPTNKSTPAAVVSTVKELIGATEVGKPTADVAKPTTQEITNVSVKEAAPLPPAVAKKKSTSTATPVHPVAIAMPATTKSGTKSQSPASGAMASAPPVVAPPTMLELPPVVVAPVVGPPAGVPPVVGPPIAVPPVDTPPLDTPPFATPPVDPPPFELPPVETPPIDGPPVNAPPVDAPPFVVPPVLELPPVDTPPIDVSPTNGLPIELPPVEPPPATLFPSESPLAELPPAPLADRPAEPASPAVVVVLPEVMPLPEPIELPQALAISAAQVSQPAWAATFSIDVSAQSIKPPAPPSGASVEQATISATAQVERGPKGAAFDFLGELETQRTGNSLSLVASGKLKKSQQPVAAIAPAAADAALVELLRTNGDRPAKASAGGALSLIAAREAGDQGFAARAALAVACEALFGSTKAGRA